MLFAEVAQTSSDVAATSARLAKIARLADCLAGTQPDEVRVAVAYLSGAPPRETADAIVGATDREWLLGEALGVGTR